MKVLVVNAGSSSIKYELFAITGERSLAAGAIERIGESQARHRLQWSTDTDLRQQREDAIAVADHRAAMAHISDTLREHPHIPAFDAIGHRVVHGGARFSSPVLIDNAVVAHIDKLSSLAPLHNPVNLIGIRACRELFPDHKQVAVFDTAFHQSMPEHAYFYPLPREISEKYRIRRYGFHGSSHAYITRRCAQWLGLAANAVTLISIHLGNGASMAAVKDGCCVDTTMGLTPLEGLMMGTRCGDLDAGVVLHLQQQGLDIQTLDRMLNKQSGLKGICGKNDMREILASYDQGDEQAGLALHMYVYRIRKYIGAYMAVLGRPHAIVFTAGIGENAAPVRAMCCRDMQHLGLELDADKNHHARQPICELQKDTGAVKIIKCATDEELEIAMQTAALITAPRNDSPA